MSTTCQATVQLGKPRPTGGVGRGLARLAWAKACGGHPLRYCGAEAISGAGTAGARAMGLPITQQAKYWGIAGVLFLALMYLMGNVLVPFLVGGAIAYFLDPIADRLQRLGMSRVGATALIMLLMSLVVVLLVLAVIPTLIQQTSALVNAAPEISRNLQTFLTERFPELSDETSVMRQTLADIGAFIQSKGGDLAQGVLTSAMSVLSAVVFIVVVPVVAFYLLLD